MKTFHIEKDKLVNAFYLYIDGEIYFIIETFDGGDSIYKLQDKLSSDEKITDEEHDAIVTYVHSKTIPYFTNLTSDVTNALSAIELPDETKNLLNTILGHYGTKLKNSHAWWAEDVVSRYQERYDKVLPEDIAESILRQIFENHDANVGVNWEVIDIQTDLVLAELGLDEDSFDDVEEED